jgi:Hydroxyneurosporene synthase (CrtC).
MSTGTQSATKQSFTFASSIEADVWHPKTDPKAYEWWYFDALSDDGREAVIIVFLDNFIFSPRYNQNRDSRETRFPAVSFLYYRDGKPVYRAVNEFSAEKFTASRNSPGCHIGDSFFNVETAPYGSGYIVSVNAFLGRNKRIEAAFEWLSIDADLAPESFCFESGSHCWNMVAPRSDVTGRIKIYDKRGRQTDVQHFRGTGYHDHNIDNRWIAETLRDWHWGRAHFADATAVFYRYCEIGDDQPATKLFVIRDGEMRERNVEYDEQNYARNRFGIRYPTRLRLISEDNLRLRVKPLKIIDSSFYYLRFLSEMTLTLRDGRPRKTIGITEFIAPENLKHRWLDWITDMRIGKNGKAPLLS